MNDNRSDGRNYTPGAGEYRNDGSSCGGLGTAVLLAAAAILVLILVLS